MDLQSLEFREWMDGAVFYVPTNTGYMGDGFYRSKDQPTVSKY